MRIQTAVVLAINAAFISAVPLATSPAAAPAGTVIGDIVTGGAGCPQSSATVVVEPGNSTFEVSTPNLISTSDSSPRVKNCQVNIPITYPTGYQYGIQEIDYSGHETVPSGSSGTARGSFYFSGSSTTTSFNIPISSGTDADLAGTYVPAATDVVWSPCASGGSEQTAFNVNFVVSIGASSTVGSVSIGKSVVDLAWRTC
jgi:hypothetical protein